MKAAFRYAACFVCFASQAVAGDADPAKDPDPVVVQSLGASPVGAARTKEEAATSRAIRANRRCQPLRNVGIAETAEHYRAACETPGNCPCGVSDN